MPNEALPPELRKPSMLDKIGGAFKGIRNNIRDFANRETELDQQIRQNREDEQSERIQRAMDDAAGKDPLRENVELDRIKTLTSKVLKG